MSVDLTLDEIDLLVAAVGQLCGQARAANEIDLYERADGVLVRLELAAKEIRRGQ